MNADPNYGSQRHQRCFLAHLANLQEKYPCTKGCAEHRITPIQDEKGKITTPACYTDQQLRESSRAVQSTP
ncbi:MAG TPA: hypothetical protein VGM94_01195 [Galbitalea sp.]|jgi:hypothetical protein